MRESRKHVRTRLVCTVKVTNPDIGEFQVKTRDISDGGVYLVTTHAFSIGDRLSGQVLGMAEAAPVVEMEVVRIDGDGVGVKFIEP